MTSVRIPSKTIGCHLSVNSLLNRKIWPVICRTAEESMYNTFVSRMWNKCFFVYRNFLLKFYLTALCGVDYNSSYWRRMSRLFGLCCYCLLPSFRFIFLLFKPIKIVIKCRQCENRVLHNGYNKYIIRAISLQQVTCLLDFSAAIDTINHSISFFSSVSVRGLISILLPCFG